MFARVKTVPPRGTPTAEAGATLQQHYTAFLSDCTSSRAFEGEDLHKSTSAVHQWLPFGVTNALSAGRDVHNRAQVFC